MAGEASDFLHCPVTGEEVIAGASGRRPPLRTRSYSRRDAAGEEGIEQVPSALILQPTGRWKFTKFPTRGRELPLL